MPSALASVRLGCALALCAMLVPALCSTAAAVPTKPFSVSFSEDDAAAGVTSPAFTVTITNETGNQMLGAAEVTVPDGFIVSVPTVDRGKILDPLANPLLLRNLAVPPTKSVKLQLSLRRPCLEDTDGMPDVYTWGVTAKQSNDYSGTGNDLTAPPDSELTNTVSGQCALEFKLGGAPARTEKDQPIRADGFQPESPNLVSVEALDGNGGRLDWFTGSIAMELGGSSTPEKLVQPPGGVLAVAGIAGFANLSITDAGTYTLRASSDGFTATESAAFPIVDEVTACGIAECVTSIGSAGALTATSITVAAGEDPGFLSLSKNVGLDPHCDGYKPPVERTWYEFELIPQASETIAREKTIVLNYTKAQMRTVKGGQSSLEVCFATPGGEDYPAFPVKGGGLATAFDYDNDGGEDEGWAGLLPNCPADRTTQCVTRRGSLKGGGAFIEFFAPGTLGDPRYH